MRRFQRHLISATACAVLLATAGAPALAAEPAGEPVAYLDGREIPLEEVGKHYCDDFDYPVIQCSSTPILPAARATLVTLFSSADYVTIWDGSSYTGVSMNISQDYTALVMIGWNDAVSSFKSRNSGAGRFTTDWFYGGSSFWFCCNHTFPTLGSWNNTFSAVQRT